MAKKSDLKTTDFPMDGEPSQVNALQTMGGMGLGKVENINDAPDGATMLAKVVKLDEPGQYIDGILEGPGPAVEGRDADGELVKLNTFTFAVGRHKFALISSYQLDSQLPEHFGKRARVTFHGQTSTKGGRRVNDFIIHVYN
jgi:hypothetical protein